MHPPENLTTTLPAVRPRGHGVADLVRWGPVVSGVVVGLGAFALFDTLWFAIAAGNGSGPVENNLKWFVGGTAVGALLVAGFVSGLLAGVRGLGAGLANGVTTWGLLVVLAVVGGIPGTLGLNGTFDLGMTVDQVLWTVFWSLLIGLGCAALGGLLGGLIHRPVVTPADRFPAAQDNRGEHRSTVITGNRVAEEDRPAPAVNDERRQTVGLSRP